MGLIVRPSEVTKQTDSMIKSLQADNESLEGVLPKIDSFVSEGELDGQAWKGLKNQLSGHRSVIQGLISANELAMSDSETLATAVSVVTDDELNEDELREEINDLIADISKLESRKTSYQESKANLSRNLFAVDDHFLRAYYTMQISSMTSQIATKNNQKRHLEEKLDLLYELESSTADLYIDSNSLYDAANQGISALESSWTGDGFSLPSGSAWQKTLDDSWLTSESKMVKDLKEAGWDQDAIDAYKEYVKKETMGLPSKKRKLRLNELHDETYLVGSDLYEVMFNAYGSTDFKKGVYSKEGLAQKKIDLMLTQMGAVLNNEMLELNGTHKFAPSMPPHSSFLESIAKNVREAFPKGLLPQEYMNQSEMVTKIHQFRMYIDKQNIEYIRNNYQGKNDLEKLLSYGKEYSLDFSEQSRLHNRYLKGESFEGQINDKIKTENGLSEFIINGNDGSFVTQWDVLQVENDGKVTIKQDDFSFDSNHGKEMVETESFNYGNDKKSHDLLDVQPANVKNGMEHPLKEQAKQHWISEKQPSKGGKYREKYNNFDEYPVTKGKK